MLIQWNFSVNREEKGVNCFVALVNHAGTPGSTSSGFHSRSGGTERWSDPPLSINSSTWQRKVFSLQHAIGQHDSLPLFLCGGGGEQWELSVHLLTQQRRGRSVPLGSLSARRSSSSLHIHQTNAFKSFSRISNKYLP